MPNIKPKAFITPHVLLWARERGLLTIDKLASKLNVSPSRIEAWERGADQPSFKQAEHLAGILHVPLGYFFLDSPPIEVIPLPDFRSGRAGERRPSADLLDLVSDIRVKQQWYREFLDSEGAKDLPFIGSFNLSSSPELIAANIRETIHLESAQEAARTPEDLLSKVIGNCERVGILVMKSGVVGSNSHRKLSPDEFRGFSISDPKAPVVFINGTDTKAAQVFTLAHELSHLWLGQSGISNETPEDTASNDIERLCNAVAAEALVPKEQVRPPGPSGFDMWLTDNTRKFRVSSLVLLRIALDLRFISRETFNNRYHFYLSRLKEQEDSQEGGGNFFPTLLSRNSKRFTQTVIESIGEGKTLYLEGAKLLNVKVPTIHKIQEYIMENYA